MAQSGKSQMQPISAAHVRLGQALRAARVAAGIKTRYVPSDRPDRRYFSSSHISLVENGRTAPSPELIDAYARFSADGSMLRALYEQALAAAGEAARRRRGSQATSESAPPQELGELTSRDDVQRHYVVERNDVDYFFDATGAMRLVRCSVALRAKSSGVRLYYAGHSYPADQRPGVLSVHVESGARIEEVRESESGSLQTFFALDRPISPADSDPYELIFTVAVHSSVVSIPRLRYHAVQGNQRMTLRAQFQPPALPDQIWWFAVPSVVDAEHPRPESALSLVETNEYSRDFDRLVPGWCYGFGWTWRR